MLCAKAEGINLMYMLTNLYLQNKKKKGNIKRSIVPYFRKYTKINIIIKNYVYKKKKKMFSGWSTFSYSLGGL
jgi:hypothetical protein